MILYFCIELKIARAKYCRAFSDSCINNVEALYNVPQECIKRFSQLISPVIALKFSPVEKDSY